MKISQLVTGACFTGLSTLLTACGGGQASDANVTAAEVDTLDERDQGTSWNGWSQTVSGTATSGYAKTVTSTLSRSSGDLTRGGGGCFVVAGGVYGGGSCTVDTDCDAAAQAYYGSSAHGYCYSGGCFARPGTQFDYCAVNSNRTPGTIYKDLSVVLQVYPGYAYALGCMTKTVGPNAACGGSVTTAYMRTTTSVLVN